MDWHGIRPHEIFSTVSIIFLAYYMWKLYYKKSEPDSIPALEGMADALNTKSPYYSKHSERVALISNAICDAMEITGREKDLIIRAAKLHDIGKLFIDEEVLHKEGKLTEEEWKSVKLHPVKGGQMAKKFGISEPVHTMILYHHENMDGTGYPLGIAAENIPMGARILRVADSIDAMAMPRPYREAYNFQQLHDELFQYSGKYYDETLIKKVTNGLHKRIKLIILNHT